MRNINGDGGHGRGVFQIDDRYHQGFLSKHGSPPPVAEAAIYAAGADRRATSSTPRSTGVPEKDRLRVAVAGYNAGMGGAMDGLPRRRRRLPHDRRRLLLRRVRAPQDDRHVPADERRRVADDREGRHRAAAGSATGGDCPARRRHRRRRRARRRSRAARTARREDRPAPGQDALRRPRSWTAPATRSSATRRCSRRRRASRMPPHVEVQRARRDRRHPVPDAHARRGRARRGRRICASARTASTSPRAPVEGSPGKAHGAAQAGARSGGATGAMVKHAAAAAEQARLRPARRGRDLRAAHAGRGDALPEGQEASTRTASSTHKTGSALLGAPDHARRATAPGGGAPAARRPKGFARRAGEDRPHAEGLQPRRGWNVNKFSAVGRTRPAEPWCADFVSWTYAQGRASPSARTARASRPSRQWIDLLQGARATGTPRRGSVRP